MQKRYEKIKVWLSAIPKGQFPLGLTVDKIIQKANKYFSRNTEFDKSLQLLDELISRNYKTCITKDNEIILEIILQ